MTEEQKVPPGIIAFKDPKTGFMWEAIPHGVEHYEEYVKISTEKGFIIHTVSVDGKEWSVGDAIQGLDRRETRIIESFVWSVDEWFIHSAGGADGYISTAVCHAIKIAHNPSLNKEEGKEDWKNPKTLKDSLINVMMQDHGYVPDEPPLPEQGKEEIIGIRKFKNAGELVNFYLGTNCPSEWALRWAMATAIEEYAKNQPQSSSNTQKISIGEILMRHNITPLAELVDELEDNLREPSLTREFVCQFLEWSNRFFGRTYKENIAGHWYSFDDLLSEEPLTTSQLLDTYISEKTRTTT